MTKARALLKQPGSIAGLFFSCDTGQIITHPTNLDLPAIKMGDEQAPHHRVTIEGQAIPGNTRPIQGNTGRTVVTYPLQGYAGRYGQAATIKFNSSGSGQGNIDSRATCGKLERFTKSATGVVVLVAVYRKGSGARNDVYGGATGNATIGAIGYSDCLISQSIQGDIKAAPAVIGRGKAIICG